MTGAGRDDSLVATVVVATSNRAALLPKLFAGLTAQVVDAGPFDVVVVNDASSDNTAEVLDDLVASAPFPVTVVHLTSKSGPAHARNEGIAKATAPIVAFTDDDCAPQPGWLASLLAGIARGADIVQGRTMPDPSQPENWGPFARSMEVPEEQGYYETCNIAYRLSLLDDLGGFDETFGQGLWPFKVLTTGEDLDLAWRARESGATTSFAPTAVVHHEVFPTDWRGAMRRVPWGTGLHDALGRHPDAVQFLDRPIFHRPGHQPAAVAAAGLALIALRPRSIVTWGLAAAAGLRYARRCKGIRPEPPAFWQWAIVVPESLALDLYEIAVFAYASARHRLLLL